MTLIAPCEPPTIRGQPEINKGPVAQRVDAPAAAPGEQFLRSVTLHALARLSENFTPLVGQRAAGIRLCRVDLATPRVFLSWNRT